jgi:DNA-binding transcriptional ArsR family regulator
MDLNRHDSDRAISGIASAIGEPARVRILYSLLDGRARTATELAGVAEVSPSTTSVHLKRLQGQKLIRGMAQGKHRYYSLYSSDVADALEALNIIAGNSRNEFIPNTPSRLTLARTCYDHIAGKLGVLLYCSFTDRGWFSIGRVQNASACELSAQGRKGFQTLGASTWKRRIDCGGGSRMSAWIGVSGGLIWAERWRLRYWAS